MKPVASRTRGRVQDFGALIVLVLIAAYFSVASDRFLSVPVMKSLLESAAIPIIVVIGLTMVMLQGSIDLSVEGVVSLTAMLVTLLVANSVNGNDYGAAGIVLALGAGAAFGLANGLLYVTLRIPSFIVTIGTWFVALGGATLLFPGRAPVIIDSRLTSLALFKVGGLSVLVYLTAALFVLAIFVERHTRFGRMSLAIGSDEGALAMSGIKAAPYKVWAFVGSGVLAAAAGLFSAARLGVGNPLAGQGLLFPAISAAVIGGTLLSGGRGGVYQSVLGVLVLETLRQGLIQTGANPLLYQVIQGAVIILAVAASTWRLRAKGRVVK